MKEISYIEKHPDFFFFISKQIKKTQNDITCSDIIFNYKIKINKFFNYEIYLCLEKGDKKKIKHYDYFNFLSYYLNVENEQKN